MAAQKRAELGEVVALPASGEVFADVRGEHRWMRVTWHDDQDVVVLSLWRDGRCVSTVRLDRAAVPALVTALVEGLARPDVREGDVEP